MIAAPAQTEPRVNRRARGSQAGPDREALRKLWMLLLALLTLANLIG